MLPESTYLTIVLRQFHDLIEYSDQQRFDAYYGSREWTVDAYRSFASMLINRAAELVGANGATMVLKDPELSRSIPSFAEVFGTAQKLLIMIRDPYDVVESMIRVEERKSEPMPFEELLTFVFGYYYGVRADVIAACYPEPDFQPLVVKYEELVTSDPGTLGNLANYLGIKAVSTSWAENSTRVLEASDPTHSALFHSAPSQSRIGLGRRSLTREQALRVTAVFSGVLAEHGYEVEPGG